MHARSGMVLKRLFEFDELTACNVVNYAHSALLAGTFYHSTSSDFVAADLEWGGYNVAI